jgi:Xaa-Pro aminopeptidase
LIGAIDSSIDEGGNATAVDWSRGESTEELSRRVGRLQARMREEGLDALLVTAEANVRYITGYHSPFWQSPTRPWYVVLPVDAAAIAVVPTSGADAFARANVGEVITWPAPRTHDEGITELLQAFGKVRKVSGKIGAELSAEMVVRMPLLDFEHLRAQVGTQRWSIVDGGSVLKKTRLIKSSAEVAKTEAACRIQSIAYEKLPGIIAEGMTEVEVCRWAKGLFLSHGADDVPYTICRSGPLSYSDIIGHATERKLQRGDMLVLDAGCQVDGYHCDFNRNFAVGSPTPEVQEAYDRLYAATEVALATARPGATFRDLYTAMAGVLGISETGGVGRMGHSVGLQLTEWPSIHPSEATVLEEGMVLSIEPSMDLASGGGRFVVTEEDIVITAAGYRLLSRRAPRAIPSILEVSSRSERGAEEEDTANLEQNI